MEDSREEMEAVAEVAVDKAAEAVEADIATMQTTEVVDIPEEAAETVDIDIEGRQ